MTHPARPPHVTLADHFADPEASRHPLGALFGALGGGVAAAVVARRLTQARRLTLRLKLAGLSLLSSTGWRSTSCPGRKGRDEARRSFWPRVQRRGLKLPNPHTGEPHAPHSRDHVLQAWEGTAPGREVPRHGEAERQGWHAEDAGHDLKEFESIMKGYHDLVEHGRREIYKIEG